MNIKEVTIKTGLNEHTLRKWEKDFKISVPRNDSGYRDYTEETIKKLLAIKALREADNGINTIKNHFQTEQPIYNLDNPETILNTGKDENLIQALDIMQKNLISKLDIVDNLSEKLSRASYEIGKLQAEKAGIEEKLLLITDGNNKDITNLKNEIQKLKQENDKLRFGNEALEKELETEKRTAWYKKIFR